MEPARHRIPWHTAGGDNSRRGLFPHHVNIEPAPARVLPAEGAVQASVVFDEEGRAFVADMAGWVQAFSAQGERLWQMRLEGGISSTPAVHPRSPWLFVGTHQGQVAALETTSGKTRWQTAIPTRSDPRILSDLLCLPQSGLVVLSSWGGEFLALDAATGTRRFSWSAGISPSAGATADPAEDVYCLRAEPGRGLELVRVDAGGRESVLHTEPAGEDGERRALVSAAPVWDGQRELVHVLINQDEGALLLGWSAKSSALLRRHPVSNPVSGTIALLSDGTVVLGDRAGLVQALDEDGTVRYRYATGCEYLLAGVVADQGGQVFLGDPVGAIHQINPRGLGRPIFEAGRGIEARPSFDTQGNLYVPSTDRLVHVFEQKGTGIRG